MYKKDGLCYLIVDEKGDEYKVLPPEFNGCFTPIVKHMSVKSRLNTTDNKTNIFDYIKP